MTGPMTVVLEDRYGSDEYGKELEQNRNVICICKQALQTGEYSKHGHLL